MLFLIKGFTQKPIKKGETPIKLEISVPEVVEIFKEIQEQPEKLFNMIRVEIRENVGEYLSTLMNMELTHFLGCEYYEHGQGKVNHRNGSYPRQFTLKGIGGIQVEVPRDRKSRFTTQVFPEVSGMRMSFGKT
ncbi:MAG: transposase [Thermodesulfobacteriota bacterium]